ncbi:MAG: hypothetical protein LBI42_11240 [Chitinispirillales bacterium]|jgi:hypothetical protein|nr:hypothetical protein [Chitinispirillales bacterium]
MKGKDSTKFLIIVTISFVAGLFTFDENFDRYSDLITFLSIMIGFKISSLAILFNSPLRKKLWDANNVKPYETELHRIKDYYKHSIFFEMTSIILIFIIPEFWNIGLLRNFIYLDLGKQSIVFPILMGSAYCLYKICKDLFRIFTFPTNN